MEVAAECIPTTERAKCKIPWESLVVRMNQGNFKKASLPKEGNSTNANALKLKKAKRTVTNIYQKEQLEYIQGQIDKIRNLIEDKPSRIASQAVNKVR